MRAGNLNKQIKLQRKQAGRDGAGQPKNDWEDVATVWADIRYATGLEAVKAGAETSLVRASIRIRYREGVTSAMRFVNGATVYNIKAVLPNSAKREHLDVLCEVTS